MNRRSWVLFTLMGVIWGTPYLFIRIGLRQLTPETMILFRCVLSVAVLLPAVVKERKVPLLFKHWFAFIIFAVVEIATPWYLIALAEEHITSSLAGLLVATVPTFGVIFALAFRSEVRVSRIRLLGLLVGFIGVGVVIGIDVGGANVASIAEALICASGYALGPVILNRYLSEIPHATMVAGSLFLTMVIYLPFGITHLPSHLSASVVGSVIGLGVFCSATGFMLFFALIREVGPARATVVTYINPIVAVVAGMIFLNERFSTGLAFGLPLVIVGSVLATLGATHETAANTPLINPVSAHESEENQEQREVNY